MKQTKFKKTEIGMIPEDWELKPLSQIAEFTRGFSYKGSEKSQLEGKFAFITLNSVKEGGGFKKEFCFITSDRLKERHFVNAGDIVIANTEQTKNGTLLGFPALVEFPSEYDKSRGVFSHHITKVSVNGGTDKEFFYFSLIYNQKKAVSYHTGSVIWSLDIENWSTNELYAIPDIFEQKSIAKVLSDLDAKIELNQQMNKTLESIGQALFKRWFVDFEFPDENGNPYQSSGGEMVDSELGKVPKGWEVGNLIDVTEIVMGQSPPGESYNETGEGISFYQGNRDFGFRYPSNRVFCVSPTRFAKEGDILLSVRAPVGELNIAVEKCAIGRGLCAIRMRNFSNSFLLYLLKLKTDLWNNFNSEGTVFGCLNKTELHKIKIVFPPDAYLRAYDEIMLSMDNKILINEKQNRHLSQIRDSLLPRLMSGRIRVGDFGEDSA